MAIDKSKRVLKELLDIADSITLSKAGTKLRVFGVKMEYFEKMMDSAILTPLICILIAIVYVYLK
jgi:hypothetical protein